MKAINPATEELIRDYDEHDAAEEQFGKALELREDYPEIFEFTRQFDRLRLYSIAYDIRDLTMFPPPAPAGQLNEHHALNRLRRTVIGQSHLDSLDAGTGAGVV